METVKTIDVFLNSANTAVHQFFSGMIPMEVLDGPVANEVNDSFQALINKFEAVGLIEFSGKHRGFCSFHIKKDLAKKIAMQMKGTKDVTESQAYDAVGEVANIMVGIMKTEASYADVLFDISCPKIIRGEELANLAPVKGRRVGLANFTIDSTPAVIAISLAG